nr:MAG TPA: protein of unknown function DUF1244 [Caudoviricetes sp.]
MENVIFYTLSMLLIFVGLKYSQWKERYEALKKKCRRL